MTYFSAFLYRVPKTKAEAFLQALAPIMRLFEEAGAEYDELLRSTDMSGKFGALSLVPAFGLGEDEELWVEIARFKSVSHMREVHALVEKNPRLEMLHARFDLLITGKDVYHAEFELVQRAAREPAKWQKIEARA